MKILVTGGAGFIGSAVIRHLILHTEHEVCNLDKLTYAGNLNSLTLVSQSPRYQFVHADICDLSHLTHVIEAFQPDVVMHLAAESHVDRSIDGPAVFLETNVMGTFLLLQATCAYWKALPQRRREAFRFHHISTDEVYGDLPPEKEVLFTESSPYDPSSPYAASKASSDHLVRAWRRTYGLPILLTNCSNNYGAYQFPEKLIPHMIINALEGRPLPLYGNGLQVRDWLEVEDHARALCLVLERGKEGETYNIGGHNERTNRQVVEEVCACLEEVRGGEKRQNSNPYRDLITYVVDRPGHDLRYAVDASKLERELGWVPAETFESGLRKTVQWYCENEVWWRQVLEGTYILERKGRELS